MPGIAPRFMAWQRHMGGSAGPLSASGEAENGNPVLIELWVNGEWIDITSYVMVRDTSGNISITRGQRDEGSSSEQSTCQMTLNNQSGNFSPRNPVGTYYGQIGRNTPVRVSVPNGLGGKSYRFWGEISSWPQSWDPTGTDVWTDIDANGVMRRLSQGPPSAHSVIYDAITKPHSSSLVAYWPCEDVDGSAAASSGLSNGALMTTSGTVTFASYEGFAASDPVVDLTAGSLTGGVVTYTEPTETQVRFLVHIPSDGLTDGKVICSIDQVDYSPGSTQFWELYYSTSATSLILRAHDADGAMLGASLDHTFDVRGKEIYVSVEFREVGTGTSRALRITDLDTLTTYSVTDTANLTQLSLVTQIAMGPASRSVVGPAGTIGLPDTAVGHITVEDRITAIDILGYQRNPVGETAGRRVERLCDASSLPFDSYGDLDETVAMGQQSKSNALSLMQECELADGGMLHEKAESLGLAYRTRNALCNQEAQLTLDYGSFNLSEVPTPVEDDRYIQNQVVVTVGSVSQTYALTEGSLSTALPPAGVGVYGAELTLNLADSGEALDQAAWRVHMGTVDEARYPQISVNLAHSSFTSNPALKQAVLALRQGDRILVQNPPAWLPPDDIDQIILGFSESITHFEHRVTFVCAPASPYLVAVSDTSLARVDTDGSELVSSVTSSGTSLTVAASTDDLSLWTTDTAQAPFDVRISGEVLTVTAVTSSVLDAFGRTESGAWGTADVGGAWTVSGGTVATDYAVAAGVGTHTLTTVNSTRRSISASTFADFDLYVDVTTSATATGASLFGGPMARYIDSNNLYMARLEFTTGNVVVLTLRKRTSGTETQLATYTVEDTYVAGTNYRVRFQGDGSALKARVWQSTAIEPLVWQVSASDSDFQAAGSVGARSIAGTGNTNVNPVVSYDNFTVTDPQIFTVSRSINGVVKAQSAGAAVFLDKPAIVALG